MISCKSGYKNKGDSNMIRQMINPDLYHGKLPWNKFEGWYFKICCENTSFALIPGIFQYNSKKSAPHAFIQFMDGNKIKYYYNQYPCHCFKAESSRFKIYIDNNIFSLSGLSVNLTSDILSLNGTLHFSKVEKWYPNRRSHRSMGYYNFIPFMQCYSQVCAMNMVVDGNIEINGSKIKISSGKGYIEKNWGSSFPYSWIWIQCNNFSNPSTSISASIGHIPFLLGSFRGFLIGVSHEGQFYEFTTMNKSHIRILPCGRDVEVYAENSNYELYIRSKTKPEEFLLANGPINGGMHSFVKETLIATTFIQLLDKNTGKIIIEDTGCNAGIEYGGDYRSIMDKKG